MLIRQLTDAPDLGPREVSSIDQLHGREPQLGPAVALLHVDVGRFRALAAEAEETEAFEEEEGRRATDQAQLCRTPIIAEAPRHTRSRAGRLHHDRPPEPDQRKPGDGGTPCPNGSHPRGLHGA